MFAAYGGNTERGIRERNTVRQIEVEQLTKDQERERRIAAEKARRQTEFERYREALAKRREAAKAELDAIVATYRLTDIGRRPVRDIIKGMAEAHGYTYAEIIGPRREKVLVKVRHACIRAVADQRPDYSLSMIGRLFQRDHTSILWALKKTARPGEHWRA